MNDRIVVTIRSREDDSAFHEIDVTKYVGTSNYDKFIAGLAQNVDYERFYIDSELARSVHVDLMGEG